MLLQNKHHHNHEPISFFILDEIIACHLPEVLNNNVHVTALTPHLHHLVPFLPQIYTALCEIPHKEEFQKQLFVQVARRSGLKQLEQLMAEVSEEGLPEACTGV